MDLEIKKIKKQLDIIRDRLSNPEDQNMLKAIDEALKSGLEGNYPVGAVFISSIGGTFCSGRNRSFVPRFDSAAHAEMEAIDRLEESLVEAEGCLFTTLEPCLLCTSRILLSKVKKVIFLVEDPSGGGTQINKVELPSNYKNLYEKLDVRKFEGNKELINIGNELYRLGETLWNEKYSFT